MGSSTRNGINTTETVIENDVLRVYYTEVDFFLSAAGILKVLSVIVCIVSAVLFLSGGSCTGAPMGLAASAATVALVCAAAMALLYAGAVLGVPLYAPQVWLYTDLIVSTVMGILLLVTSIMSMTFCSMNRYVDYIHGPLAALNAVMVIASGIITYMSVMRKLDAVSGPRREPRRPLPTEQEA